MIPLLLLAFACNEPGEDDTAPVASTGCNGADHLCDRRYDEVAYGSTHNAMSNAEEGWSLPNQQYRVPTQLQDGVRALMLDLHYWQDDVWLCHGDPGADWTCPAGNKLAVETLTDIRTFLDAHPREIVTIIFESYVDIDDLAPVFTLAGLDPTLHAQADGEPWPTLQQLIDADTRLVVFSNRDGGARPWHHGIWDWAWDTEWDILAPEDFDCTLNRGSTDSPLFVLNNFLTLPAPARAALVNEAPFLTDRVVQCRDEAGQLPNFVNVDFYDVGDLFEAVDLLNAP